MSHHVALIILVPNVGYPPASSDDKLNVLDKVQCIASMTQCFFV